MNRIIRLRDGSSLDLLGLGVLAVVVATIVLGVMLIAPTVSMYRHPPEAPKSTRDSAAAAKKYNDALAWQREQVAGRSMFYKPLPPTDKPEDTTVAKFYGGPSLLAFVNGTAWFSDGQKVSAKEPDSTSLHFVKATPPWNVRVRWQGTEFDVKLFDKTELSSLTSPSALSSSGVWAGSSSKPVMPEPEKPNFPPEAKAGPGANQPGAAAPSGTDAPTPSPSGSPPPPPPPPGGANPPLVDPIVPSSGPSPAPGTPTNPQPSPAPEPQKEPGASPEPIRPSHP